MSLERDPEKPVFEKDHASPKLEWDGDAKQSHPALGSITPISGPPTATVTIAGRNHYGRSIAIVQCIGASGGPVIPISIAAP